MSFWKERDKFILKLVNWIPEWVKPNYITFFRLLLIIPLVWLLMEKYFIWAIFLALFAFFTDMVDGTLARKRNQISNFGKLADPIADKAVYFLIFLFIAWGNISFTIIFFMLVSELSLVIASLIFGLVMLIVKIKVKDYGANWIGKIKTPIQILGVVILAFSLKFGWSVFPAEIILWVGIGFAFLNLFSQIINPNNYQVRKS